MRVSATEVWLRDLEARRLSVGKRFFLAAPQNLYQISYYEVTEMSDPSGGFVTVKCVTPSTDDALNRYEAENQVMMLDPGSIGSRAFAGLPAGTQIFLLGDSIEIAQDAFEGADVLLICPENSAGWQYAQDHHLAVLQP